MKCNTFPVKTYLVGYEVQDGENQYEFQMLIKAKTLDKATETAEKILAIWTEQENEYRIYSFLQAQEIKDTKELDILQRLGNTHYEYLETYK